jgi:hypothetical protein
MSLPPLPEPEGVIVVRTQARRAFTAEQMQEYAAAAVAAERARLIAELRAMHDWQKTRHNYYLYAAQLLEGKQ